MKIVKSPSEMREISISYFKEGKRISLVPTMGFFHEGHISLMKKAREYGDVLVVSLFVNPTQFAPNEDFESYPRNFEKDCRLAEEAGADVLFCPDTEDMYPEGYATIVNVGGVAKKFEGASRPSHFSGVATVVSKLFNIIRPDFAVFGQKDYQQTLVIKRITQDLNLGVNIVIAPTDREPNGLARSSRNSYLSEEHKETASIIFETLEEAIGEIEKGEKRRKIINAIMIRSLRRESEIKIDYCMAADADNLNEPEEFQPGQRVVLVIAVYLGKTRLIDNAVSTIPKFIG